MREKTNSDGSLIYLTLIVLVATMGGLLFGYDTAVISGAIGFLQENFELSPAMKGWAASSALVGCVAGVALAGWLNDALGRKVTLIVAAILFLVSAIGSAMPDSFTEFIIYRIIGGLGVGAASMTSPMYIAEISPARLRGRMVSLNQLAIIFGMLVVYFVNFSIAGAADDLWNVEQGWRWMFASEAIPAFLLLVLLFFVPESPRWLAQKGRFSEAESIFKRVDGEANAAEEMREIRSSLSKKTKGSFGELWKPGMRVVVFLGLALAVLQQVTGINVFLYYAPEIFKAMAGADSDVALMQTIVVGVVNLLFTILAIWLVDRAGRKPLMIIGAIGMGISLTSIGCAAMFGVIGGWLLVFVLGYIACFALSVGPVTWVYLSEMFPNQVRGQALAVATLGMWVSNFVVSQTFPMMDENAFLVEKFNHGFPFFLYALFCLALLVVMKFLPETKGRSLEEIEDHWESRK